jgi:hypothetical protein
VTTSANVADTRADLSISLERANVLALAMLPLLVAALVGPFFVLYGWNDLAMSIELLFGSWSNLIVLAIAIVAHETLHAVGFLLGGAPPASLHFGVQKMSPYAGCRAPLEIGAYRLAIALPGLVLGVLPWLWGMATGAGWLVLWAAVMLMASAGDMIIFWITRRLPYDTTVLDHPTRAGCQIVGPANPAGQG